MGGCTLHIDEELAAKLRAVAGPSDEEMDRFALALLQAELSRSEEEQKSNQRAEGYAQGKIFLHGPARRFDPEAIRQRYGLPDLAHLSTEEREVRAESILAKVSREKIAVAENLGFL